MKRRALSRASRLQDFTRPFFLVVYLRFHYTDEAKGGLLVVYAQSRCQFTEILWYPDYVNLQRFYGAPLCQFTEILWCPDHVNIQRFYGAPTMSIYRDFMVPRLCQFTEILWCPDYVIYRDFVVPRLCQFTEILHDQAKRVKSL